MNYRPEIDGLRAIAVVSVILFHAGFDAFSGGFIGVDVFFVISGYLITTIIVHDLERGRFSIARFYERRARRILPMLFFMIAVCLPPAWIWMTPERFSAMSLAVLMVSIFGSNILFWRETNYFAPSAEENPLLHTWSLAVEEQYYIFFPIFMMLIWRYQRNRVAFWLLLITAVSLLMSELLSRTNPVANFYLLPTRAWEIMAGSLCSMLAARQASLIGNLLSTAGLVAVGGSVVLFDEAMRTPSLITAVPIAGTAMVILYGVRESWVARLLSLKFFVGIGLISYSAYLWHQPLFAFARIRLPGELSTMLLIGLVILTHVLAFLSWKYVEKPFRSRSNPFLASTGQVLGTSAGMIVLLVGLGAFGYVQGGFPWRTNLDGIAFRDLRIDEKLQVNYGLHADCEHEFNTSGNCRTSDHPRMLLWGDSFAMHLGRALTAGNDIGLQQQTKSACAPVLGISVASSQSGKARAEGCIRFNDQVLQWLETATDIETVVLSSSFYILRSDIIDRSGVIVRQEQQTAHVAAALIATADAIRERGKKVVLISPPPNNGNDIGACLAATMQFGGGEYRCDFTVDEFSRTTLAAFNALKLIEHDVPVIWLTDFLCSDGTCRTHSGDLFFYRDRGHLSQEGAAYIGREMNLATLAQRMAR